MDSGESCLFLSPMVKTAVRTAPRRSQEATSRLCYQYNRVKTNSCCKSNWVAMRHLSSVHIWHGPYFVPYGALASSNMYSKSVIVLCATVFLSLTIPSTMFGLHLSTQRHRLLIIVPLFTAFFCFATLLAMLLTWLIF